MSSRTNHLMTLTRAYSRFLMPTLNEPAVPRCDWALYCRLDTAPGDRGNLPSERRARPLGQDSHGTNQQIFVKMRLAAMIVTSCYFYSFLFSWLFSLHDSKSVSPWLPRGYALTIVAVAVAFRPPEFNPSQNVIGQSGDPHLKYRRTSFQKIRLSLGNGW